MKHLFIFTALALAASAASATYCSDGSLIESHPGGNCAVPIGGASTPGQSQAGTVTGEQRQQQGQAQGQQQAATARAGAQATSGAASNLNAAGVGANAGAGAGAGAGSNNATTQTTTVNTGGAAGSGDTYKSLAVAFPGAAVAVAPTMVGGSVNSGVIPCGPLVRKVATNVYGVNHGFFSDTPVYLGQSIELAPYLDEEGREVPFIARGGRWWGHLIMRDVAMSSVASGSSFGLGLAGTGGAGNAGAGLSGGMTRMVKDVDLRLCDAGPVAPPEQPMRIVFEERPVPQPPKRKPVRKVAHQCPVGQVLVCRAL